MEMLCVIRQFIINCKHLKLKDLEKLEPILENIYLQYKDDKYYAGYTIGDIVEGLLDDIHEHREYICSSNIFLEEELPF